jgi:hypothetical protein
MALIFRRAVPKRFGAQFVTGPVLAGLVHAYVNAINQGAVPTIATAWQVGEMRTCFCSSPSECCHHRWQGGAYDRHFS